MEKLRLNIIMEILSQAIIDSEKFKHHLTGNESNQIDGFKYTKGISIYENSSITWYPLEEVEFENVYLNKIIKQLLNNIK